MPIEIAFEADRLSAQPGCNGASGGYTMVDGTLTLSGPLAQTMMMCADQALVDQDAWFASVLEASPEVALDGDAIVLTTDDTVAARPRQGGREPRPAARGHASGRSRAASTAARTARSPASSGWSSRS